MILIPFIVTIGQGGVALAMTSGKQALRNVSKVTMESVINPVKSARRVPKSLQTSFKRVFKK